MLLTTRTLPKQLTRQNLSLSRQLEHRKIEPPTFSPSNITSLQIARMSAAMSTSTSQDTSTKRRKAKCFAPLNPEVTQGRDLPKLRGIVFDVDGTLWYVHNTLS